MLLEVSKEYLSAYMIVFDLELNTFNDMFNFCNERAFVKKIDFQILKGFKKQLHQDPGGNHG